MKVTKVLEKYTASGESDRLISRQTAIYETKGPKSQAKILIKRH